MPYLIAPSILAADLLQLKEEIEQVISAGADAIHLDIMDNHYVPNLTFGPTICACIHRSFPGLCLDVHLMIEQPDSLISRFAKAGASRLSIHPDSTIHLNRSLQLIKDEGCKAGLVLNPATSLDCITWCIEQLDFILVMTVNPGFGGQVLIPAVIDKIALIKQSYPHLPVCVDGGVNTENIATLAQAGASEFVIGSALFSSADYHKTLVELRKKLEN